MKRETLSIRDIILALSAMPKMTQSLLNKGKRYDALLNEVLKYCSDSDDSPLPSSTVLQQKTNLSAQKCKAYLVEIYDNFLDAIGGGDTTHKVNYVRCEFYVHFLDNYKTFNATLPVVPRIGETIRLGFLRPVFNIDTFYVERITHILRDDHQLIEISLKGGIENSYEKFITEKAMYEGGYDYIKGKIKF